MLWPGANVLLLSASGRTSIASLSILDGSCSVYIEHNINPGTGSAESASCAKVLPSPLSLWTRLIPSMMQAEGCGIVSAGDTFFSKFLASSAFSVLRIEPSPFASKVLQRSKWMCKNFCDWQSSALGNEKHVPKEVSVWLQSNLFPLNFMRNTWQRSLTCGWCYRLGLDPETWWHLLTKCVVGTRNSSSDPARGLWFTQNRRRRCTVWHTGLWRMP